MATYTGLVWTYLTQVVATALRWARDNLVQLNITDTHRLSMGPFKYCVMQWWCQMFQKKVYENVWFNVIIIMKGWMGVNFSENNVTKVYGSFFIRITRAWVGVNFPEKALWNTLIAPNEMCSRIDWRYVQWPWTDLAKKRRKIHAQGAANVRMMVSAASSLSSLMGTHSRMRTQETWNRNLAGALCCKGKKHGEIFYWV